MLNGNKSKTERRRSLYDSTIRVTHKNVIAGKNIRRDRKATNQSLRKEVV